MNYDRLNEVYEDYLEHYGVKGMEWGKKKKKIDFSTAYSGVADSIEKQLKNATGFKPPVTNASFKVAKGAIVKGVNRVSDKANTISTNRTSALNLRSEAVSSAANLVQEKVNAEREDYLKRSRLKISGIEAKRGAASGAAKQVSGISKTILKTQKKLQVLMKGTKLKTISSKSTKVGSSFISKLFKTKK